MGGFGGGAGAGGGAGSDTTAIHDNTAGEINAVAEKGSPVGTDLILIEDSADSNNKKKVQITNLPTGSDTDAIHDNVAGEIHAVTDVAPATGDEIIIEDASDSYNKKRIQLGDIPALSAPATHTHVQADITDLAHTDTDAIHDNVAGEIHAVTDVAPASADEILLEDASDSWNKKRCQISDIISGLISSLVEDTTPQLGGALDLNDKPLTIIVTAGETISAGQLVSMSNADGEWYLTDADVGDTTGGMIGIGMTSGTDGNPMTVAVFGPVAMSGITAQETYYVSTTAGALTSTAPSGSGDYIRIVGYGLKTDVLFLIPSQTWLEVT